MNNKILKRLIERTYANIDEINGTTNGKYRHVSYLILKNKIISFGYNSQTTHPIALQYGLQHAHIHSEMNTISKLPYYSMQYKKLIQKCDMVNIRLSISGNIHMSKPCDACQKVISAFGIKNVYYTTSEHNICSYDIRNVFDMF
jgi:deoxycytidylate deaminase